jgi:nucleotide-binding universal stress UspA family protein
MLCLPIKTKRHMFEVKTKRILVPVEGMHTDEESLRVACAQAKRDHAEIVVLYVIEVRRSMAIDADVGTELERGERVLEELQQLARQLGCRVQTDLLQAREAGSAIVNEAVERQVDLIAMGVPYREKFGGFKVEARALYVLDHAPCRVCLVREPLRNTVPH